MRIVSILRRLASTAESSALSRASLVALMVTTLCASAGGSDTPALPTDASSSDSASAAALAAPGDTTLPFDWTTPPGWRTETIPFPLGFAPTLSYSGVEELRFAPGMFKPESEDFWTYAFVWWLAGNVRLDAAKLNADLERYYDGLSQAVEGEDFDPRKAATTSKLTPIEPGDDGASGESHWAGSVSAYDAFATHARVELRIDVQASRLEELDRTAVTFLVSPQPANHEVWAQLGRLRDALNAALKAPPPADRGR